MISRRVRAVVRSTAAVAAFILFFINGTPLLAQNTSADLIAENPRNHYFRAKKLIQQEIPKSSVIPASEYIGEIFALPCDTNLLGDVGNDGTVAGRVLRLADEVVGIKALLEGWVPEAHWRQDLLEYESIGLAEIERGRSPFTSDSAMKSLISIAEKANDYFRSSARPGPTFSAGECGGRGAAVTLHVDPSSGRLYVITVFEYALCSGQRGVDRDNVRQCNWWRQVLPGQESYYLGRYHVRAEWPDGHVNILTSVDLTQYDEDQLTVAR
jgi:hypothetical protein